MGKYPHGGAIASVLLMLAGCPGVDLGDTPEGIGLCNPAKGSEFFIDEVWPKYIVRDAGTTSCIRAGGGCHDAQGGNALAFPSNDPMDPQVYRAAQVYLNCGTRSASLLLTKPLQGVDDPHGGGNIFTSMDDEAVKTFLEWFE